MNNPTPVYESPVKLVVVELKLDGELDDDDVGGLGLDLTGLVGRLSGDEGEGGEGGPGEVVAVLGSRKRLEGAGKGKNLLGHSEELGDPRLVGQAAQGGAWCVQNFSSLFLFSKIVTIEVTMKAQTLLDLIFVYLRCNHLADTFKGLERESVSAEWGEASREEHREAF